MAAFVPPSATPLASSASSFVSGNVSTRLSRDHPPAPSTAARRATTMKILDGLDTVNQDSYSFSRYILGPFQPTVLSANSSAEDRENAIRAAYRHVFGNAYIMEEERKELERPESQFKLGAITAKEFVRHIAKTSAYKSRFLEGASNYRFVELNFMHFLGRAPDSQAEMSEHIRRTIAEGADADIDSYIDSEEYASVFGEDNIPFLRFRGAYTPCDSFNKQCALKGGWANSDKAMGGAGISGFNGSDGRQMCDRIDAYISGGSTPYETVVENSPLRTTAPNWTAFPNPALVPIPAYISADDVKSVQARVDSLQAQYDAELAKRMETGTDPLAPFRAMVQEMAPMLDRGYAYSDPALAHPQAKLPDGGSALTQYGFKTTDYRRVAMQMENDTVSRLERDLEEARAELRAYKKALDQSTPMSQTAVLPSVMQKVTIGTEVVEEVARPRIIAKAVPKMVPVPAVEEEKGGVGIGPIKVSLPKVSLPKVSVPKVSLPFGNKDE